MSVTGDGSPAVGGGSEDDADDGWTPTERALLDAALAFYAAAGGVIDFAERDRPQVRRDATGLDAVRRAMAAFEAHVVAASHAGLSPARIAQLARMEPETIARMLERSGAAPSPSEG